MSFLKDMFSGKGPQVNYQPTGFSGGGLNASYGPGGYSLQENPNVAGNVAGASSAYGDLSTTLGDLAAKVAPGYNDLLKSRLNDINNTAASAIGSLRQTLASRRILGSSFGSDTINRANVDFQQQRDKTIAENYLQSLDASTKLAQQQYGARVQQFQVGLQQSNLEAGIAAQLTASANSALAAIAKSQAELDAQAQAGAGKFIGSALAIGAAPFTGGASLAGLGIPWNRAGGGGGQ